MDTQEYQGYASTEERSWEIQYENSYLQSIDEFPGKRIFALILNLKLQIYRIQNLCWQSHQNYFILYWSI